MTLKWVKRWKRKIPFVIFEIIFAYSNFVFSLIKCLTWLFIQIGSLSSNKIVWWGMKFKRIFLIILLNKYTLLFLSKLAKRFLDWVISNSTIEEDNWSYFGSSAIFWFFYFVLIDFAFVLDSFNFKKSAWFLVSNKPNQNARSKFKTLEIVLVQPQIFPFYWEGKFNNVCIGLCYGSSNYFFLFFEWKKVCKN